MKLRFTFLFSAIFIFLVTHAQLNSVDGFYGMNFLNSVNNKKNPSPSGTSYGIRYNQHVSWELNLCAAAAMSNSSFYIQDKLTNNSYLDFQFALQWQWLTEVRTRLAGGGKRQTCKGAKSIIFANFKSYLIGGIELRTLKNPVTTGDNSKSSLTNFFYGIGFDTYRFGKNAHHGSNAFVPFLEAYYMSNFGSPYATVDKTDYFINGFNLRFGMKYTFGFKEKKFSW
jgi:hypothetical protein